MIVQDWPKPSKARPGTYKLIPIGHVLGSIQFDSDVLDNKEACPYLPSPLRMNRISFI